MCRSILEGGRRCPHDGSDSRRARRINNSLKNAFHEDKTQTKETKNNSDDTTYTMDDVFKTIDSINSLKNDLEELSDFRKPWTGSFQGEQYTSISEALKHVKKELEKTTTELGNKIASVAYSKTGHTDKDIAYYANSKQLELEEKYVQLEKEEAKLREEVVQKLSLSSPTFAFDSLSKAYRDNPENEELSELYSRWQNNTEQSAENRTQLLNFKVKLDETYWNMVKANQNEYLNVLKEIRDFGGELKIHEDSHESKISVLNEATKFYPKEWIESSNNSTPLAVKATNKRAHYNDSAKKKTIKVVPIEHVVFKDKNFTPKEKNEIGMIKLKPNSSGKYLRVNPETNIEEEYYPEKNQTVWVKPIWEFANPYYQRYDSNGKPKGNGWEEIQVTERIYNNDSETHEETIKTFWRRQSRKRVTEFTESISELLINNEPSLIGKEKGMDCALHELAHRMEDVKPSKYLNILEKEFYSRRTSEPDGSQMKEERLYKGKNEFAVPDSFVSNYMGKKYSDPKYFEILSTGMEAVFGSNFGNLHGVNGRKKDPDMRNFILGLLSVA